MKGRRTGLQYWERLMSSTEGKGTGFLCDM